MSKVTESRRRILSIVESTHPNEYPAILKAIKELVLNDENWNEPEPKQEEIADEDKSLLDIAIDFLPDK
jgi:hypothetical protein